MRINLNNYEAFFLDYMEGKLGPVQVRELFAFLAMHPELKQELDEFEEVVLGEDIVFENKHTLKKTEYSEDSLIAYTEGLMTPAERRKLELLAAENKELQKEVALYALSRMQPDASIRFRAKAKLKRGGLVVFLQSNPVYMRAAAAVLLLSGLFLLVNKIAFTGEPVKPQPVLANSHVKPVISSVNNSASADLRPSDEKKEKTLATNTGTTNIGSRSKKEIADVTESKIKPQTDSSQRTSPGKALLAENKQGSDPARANEPVLGSAADNAVTHTSYINTRIDDDDSQEDDEPVVLASAAPVKKSFFDKLTSAARKMNALGVKKVNAGEDGKSKSLILGGIVVSESYSN